MAYIFWNYWLHTPGKICLDSLYTSIPLHQGLSALQHFLFADPLLNPWHTHFIIEAICCCLTDNYFTFNDDYYLQIQGTAMGANFAPSYANLTMGHWESTHIWNNNPFLALSFFMAGT